MSKTFELENVTLLSLLLLHKKVSFFTYFFLER